MKKWKEATVPLYFAILMELFVAGLTTAAILLALRWNNGALKQKLYEIDCIVSERYVGELDAMEAADLAAFGYMAALDDQWSQYLEASDYEAYAVNSEGNLVGIGVSVLYEGDGVLVREVYPDSPAQAAGIQAGDFIVGVDDLRVETDGASAVTAAVSGEEGTTVQVTVRGADGAEVTHSIVRALVKQKMVKSEMLANNVGYVRIESFHNGVAAQFGEAMDALVTDGAERFILDVRHNGGGRVSEMSDMLNRFLPEGRIITLRTKDGKETVFDSDAEMLAQPVVVLADASSISAAEFFAAALQESGRATVVGTATTGKGRAQQTFVLSDGSAIVLSTEEYFTAGGKNLADTGIQPDVESTLTEEQLESFYMLTKEEDTQLQTAIIEVLKK